ncbi:hypothetical protein N825_15515 [Skermanella stibiiresistens SB22]|uniref:Uncharacterized protein n=1 Tax=Skermanella stibiiresistens SB22 TaxID=1385369 RepID=W9GW00_9PROT|nr:hypothetical protein [Skermanella stibiiresistens]EWY38090.1 hypothetical protein N825_15515 [Skermanella stibiiresistens SB22]
MSIAEISAVEIVAEPNTLTVEELRGLLKGSGLVAYSPGVYHTDHILLDTSAQDRMVVCAVAAKEADGQKVVARLRQMLAGIGNVTIHTAPNSLHAG